MLQLLLTLKPSFSVSCRATSHAASDLDASPRSLLAQGWPRASREVTAAQSVLPRGGFSVDVLRKLRLCKHAGVLFSPMS